MLLEDGGEKKFDKYLKRIKSSRAFSLLGIRLGDSSIQMLGLDFGSFLSFNLVLTKFDITGLSGRYCRVVTTHMLHESHRSP
jgi:hypothetical protein